MQEKAQQQALDEASANRTRAAERASMMSQKRPDMAAIAEAAQKSRPGSMLTGPAGVDPGSLVLGKNTLLGQ